MCLAHYLHISRVWITLDVEFRADAVFQHRYIIARDVTLVGPGMHRDALGAGFLQILGEPEHIGPVLAACVAQCGYLVDVYT